VLTEMLEVRGHGLDIVICALEDPRESIVDPRARALQPEVVYLHRPGRGLRSWSELAAGALRQARVEPRGALRVAAALLRTHRSMPSVRHAVEGLGLARSLRRAGVTHLHAHFAHTPAAVAFMAHLASGIPYSVTAHAKDLYTTLPRNIVIRARAARFVVTCTGFSRDYLAGLVGEPAVAVHMLHHGSDLSRFNPAARAAQPGRILAVGRLVPKKGYETLVGALEILDRDHVAFDCEIFGGGPLRGDLAAAVESRGLTERVHLRGPQLQEVILEAYRTAAVFVLSPRVMPDGDRDGIPNVLVEAMACGVPAVSTRISGIPELIEDGVDGLLVEPGDPAALAAAIRRVITDPVLAARLGEAGRLKVGRRFDQVTNSGELKGLFEVA
jgi:glycosyltransferase involved in cell wall biosynthesis